MEPPSRYFAGVNPQQLFSQQASSLMLQQPLDTPLYANVLLNSGQAQQVPQILNILISD